MAEDEPLQYAVCRPVWQAGYSREESNAISGRRRSRSAATVARASDRADRGNSHPSFRVRDQVKAEGKVLAGGLPVGDRAFVCVIEAASNDEADRIVRDMPTWGVLEWKVTPLQSFEARAEMERKAVQALKSARR
jgi:muconolactone delta-isomerase